MAFEHPDPLQQVSRTYEIRTTSAAEFLLVAGVAGKRIRIKSWAVNNYGPGKTAIDIIDRTGAGDVNIREDYACAEAEVTREEDDDGIYLLREGASLYLRTKAALVTHTRVNYWIV